MCRCDSFRFGHQVCLFSIASKTFWRHNKRVGACTCRRIDVDMKVYGIFTCICSWQVELRPGVPWSAAVTVRAYSARSTHLRGEAVLSSPLVGLREKRSALGPSEDATYMDISSNLSLTLNSWMFEGYTWYVEIHSPDKE